MIRGIRCSTTIPEANLSPENHRGHQITFARSTHNASSKTSPLQHLSRIKALTCEDGKVNGIAHKTRDVSLHGLGSHSDLEGEGAEIQNTRCLC